jgi:quercetin dioxygenase-like cupin family protein
MQVKNLGAPSPPLVDWEIFAGDVRAAEVVSDSDASDLRIYDVTFAPGARTVWHSHTTDQVLVITAGYGTVATEAEERQVRVGDLVIVPAGERHWHGALADAGMTHLAVMTAGEDDF